MSPMQFYARQAGFVPFAQLPPRHQADVEAVTDGEARVYWWKRVWATHGWAWEPLRVS